MDVIQEYLPGSTSKVYKPAKRLLPTGTCWCGCGKDTKVGSFFLAGHDKVAESAVILREFGGVPELLDYFGYGPGQKNAREAADEFRRSGGKPR